MILNEFKETYQHFSERRIINNESVDPKFRHRVSYGHFDFGTSKMYDRHFAKRNDLEPPVETDCGWWDRGSGDDDGRI